ncbi:polysaccharide pyruvyl transferase family protein [Thalassotalea atypica]|uniref:polysaccharide pyruvyl transferase family protein n=1 Tax=Thalassotalea atypica TaxID=2054316 RepID=UPI0025737306|nr:polysaccharide pyruvyl transferase family protein [Thalassotalea atypica]
MLIEIKGVQFVNKGAELMLQAIIDQVNKLWPDAEICMEPDQNSPYLKRAEIGAYQKLRLVKNRFDFNGVSYLVPKYLRQYLKTSLGIVTEADVDMVLDASGFLYGDQWNYLPLKQASLIAKRFKKKNKQYILMPQALGPFSSLKYQQAARVLTENVAVAFARDSVSVNHVTELTAQSNVQLAPDFTNLLVPELPSQYVYLKGQVAVIPNSKMISNSNKNTLWREKYIDVLVNAIEAAQAINQKVFLLNHEGKGDQQICQQINHKLAFPVEIVNPESCLAIKSIIGQCAWVISSRYHGCVSALSQNVPCLGTSWSHKYEQLFDDYGCKNWILDASIDKTALSGVISHFAESAEQNSAELSDYSADIKESAKLVWSTISNELN